ncbi:MAG TPA: NACHT domain-containing protein [Anaerolineales bacterium]|nr:NACHT domain-containing protein [Anaerolineales bacterium]
MSDETNRYELMMDAFTEVTSELDASRQTKPIPAQPPLSRILADFGPMPEEALFLGVASDELPVLLNLHDSIPGPLLIIGDSGSGKTALLQMIAQAVGSMHQPEKVQFGALTNHPDEWSGFESSQNNVGIFPIQHRSSEDFILSLASWAHGNKSSRQSVLLLMDDLEGVSSMEMDAVHNLRWLLLRGPSRRVWPIITLNSDRIRNMEPWLDAFRTRIFGNMQNPNHISKLDAKLARLESLASGSEFTMSEGDHWLRFSIPALD